MSNFKFLLNGRIVHPYTMEVLREGERSVDTSSVAFLASEVVRHDDQFEFIYDPVDVDNLVLSLPFQNSSKDESGNALDGVDVDVSYVDVDDGRGASIAEDGSITVAYDDKLEVGSKDFVVAWRGKIDVDAVDIVESSMFAISKDGDNVQLTVGDVGSGDIAVDWDGYVTIVLRLVGNLAIASFNGESIWTSEISRVTEDDDIVLGDEQIVTDFRMYIGEHTEAFIDKLYKTFGKSFHTMWYGGKIWKYESDSRLKTAQLQSYGKELGEIEVRGNVYTDTTIDAIVKEVIEDQTDLTVVSPDRGLEIGRYVTDGYILDIVTELASLSNSTWSVDARKNFVFENKEVINTELVYEHGRNAHIFDSGLDDTELVNGITIVGEPQRVSIVEAHTIATEDREIVLGNVPIIVSVTANASDRWIDGTDYEVDIPLRKVTFLRDIQNVPLAIQYEYEKTLRVEVEDADSIAEHGRRHKRFFFAWISNKTDALRFAHTYLSIYSVLRKNVKATVVGFEYRMQENAVVRMLNSLKNIDGSFLAKSIKWKYPAFLTEVQAGEYSFDDFEARKAILAKIHNLEQYLTRNKEAVRILGVKERMVFGATLQGGAGLNSNLDISLSFSLNSMITGEAAEYGESEYGEGAYSA